MKSVFLSSAIGLVVFLLGCGKGENNSKSSAVPSKDSSSHQSEYHRDRAQFMGVRPDDGAGLDIISYALTGSFNWKTSRLEAQVKIEFEQKRSDYLTLDSRVKVKSVRLGSGGLLNFKLGEDETLQIELPKKSGPIRETVIIDYETAANGYGNHWQSALTAIAERPGDPIKGRVVYTTSEPQGASSWMPCHNVPSDRAKFRSTFIMEPTESLIANGELITDQIANGKRVITYATDYTLPTYLMAFAVGDFDSTTRMRGKIPVSVWHRRGLKGDFDGMVKTLIGFISRFEALLVPYPFEKYSLVLLPDFGGGVEHAGITFQTENMSSQPALLSDLRLASHELGHQWFGDLVTVQTWDDLWIKEGMATLLSEEAIRPATDANHMGRLMGSEFRIKEGDAIRNPDLEPEEKYNTGPYGRAAWLLTQIRAQLGEKAFWSTLTQVLKDHAYGTIGTDVFVEAFRPGLGEESFAKVKKAIAAKLLPEVSIEAGEKGVHLGIRDRETTMIRPLIIAKFTRDGELKTKPISFADGITLSPKEGEVLFFDPKDEHALTSFKLNRKDLKKHLSSFLVPHTDETKKLFAKLPANSQQLALVLAEGWDFSPEEVIPFQSAIASPDAAYRSIQVICAVAKAKVKDKTMSAWQAAVRHLLTPKSLLWLGLQNQVMMGGFATCTSFVDPAKLALFHDLIQHSPTSAEINYLDVVLMTHLDSPAAVALSTWGKLTLEGHSVRARLLGYRALETRLFGIRGFTKPTSAELPKWRGTIRQVIQSSRVPEILISAIMNAAFFKQKEVIPDLAKVVIDIPRHTIQKLAACAANRLAKGDKKLWGTFVSQLGDMSGWSTTISAIVKNPDEECARK